MKWDGPGSIYYLSRDGTWVFDLRLYDHLMDDVTDTEEITAAQARALTHGLGHRDAVQSER